MADISKERAVVGSALQSSGLSFSNVNSFYVDNDLLAMTGKQLLQNSVMVNKFIDTLINKIGVTLVNQRMYKNPFADFKKGQMPLGVAVEDIFINPQKAQKFISGYNNEIPTGGNNALYGYNDPYKINDNDVKVVYYPLNSQVYFQITVKFVEVQQAFNSWQNMDNLVNKLIENLANSAEVWEFEQTKTLLGTNFEQITPTCKLLQVASKNEIDWASEFAIKCRDLALNYTFNSNKFNNWVAWATSQGLTGVSLNPVKTNTKLEDLYLLTRADIGANIDISVLATSFNLGKAEFLGTVEYTDNFGDFTDDNGNIKIEEYPGEPVVNTHYHTSGELGNYDYLGEDGKRHHVELYGYIFDKHYIQIWETYNAVTNIENPVSLYRNYFKHLWETFALCPFANATALYTDDIVE